MHYDLDYNSALGELLGAFGLLEWNVIYAVSLYKPDYVREAEYGRITAGQIKNKLYNVIADAAPADQSYLFELADRFKLARDLRDDVIHAKPCTSPAKQQRLSRKRSILELEDLRDRIATFQAVSDEFNRFYHARRAASP